MKKICLFIGIIILSFATKVVALEQKIIISDNNLLVLNGVFDEVIGVQVEFLLTSGSFKDSNIELSNLDNSMYTVDNNKLVIYIYSTDNLTSNNNITLGKVSISGDYVYDSNVSIKLIDTELNEIDGDIFVTGNTSKVTIDYDSNDGDTTTNTPTNTTTNSSPTLSDSETIVNNIFDLMMSLVSSNIMQDMADANLDSDVYVNLDDINYVFLQNTILYDDEVEYDFGFTTESSYDDLIMSLIPNIYLETINFNYDGMMPLVSNTKAEVSINVGYEYANLVLYYYLFDKITNEFTLVDYSIVDENGIFNVNQNEFGLYVLTNNVIDVEDELEEYLPQIEEDDDSNNNFKIGFLICILIALLVLVIGFIIMVRKNNNKNLRSGGFY